MAEAKQKGGFYLDANGNPQDAEGNPVKPAYEATTSAQKLADEEGVDLFELDEGEKITKSDVEDALPDDDEEE